MGPEVNITHKPDGTERHPSVAGVLKHFRWGHLPPHLQAVSRAFGQLAETMAN